MLRALRRRGAISTPFWPKDAQIFLCQDGTKLGCPRPRCPCCVSHGCAHPTVLAEISGSADRRKRNLSQIISQVAPGSATAGCAASLAGPQAASPGSFLHYSMTLLPSVFSLSFRFAIFIFHMQPPAFSLEQCLCIDNVFTISSDLLQAYQDNQIAVDPQVQRLHVAHHVLD
jgi:hypothetical protein